jgi:hypothetical protein
MTQILCPQCGRHVEAGVKRCPHCGRTKPFPYRLLAIVGLLLAVLVAASFSGAVAERTMSRDLYAGTAKACVGDVTPSLLDDASPDFDWSGVRGRCRPTWYKAMKYGFPSVAGDSIPAE